MFTEQKFEVDPQQLLPDQTIGKAEVIFHGIAIGSPQR